VWAVSEGTPVFAGEPLLEVIAPLPEAQIAETLLINRVHAATLAASKAARVVEAARGRRVVDFGMRRAHGLDAAVAAARAALIAGADATSNVLAGARYGIPVAGTMAHSFVQAHDDEAEALRRFARTWPDTILIVDTYDTIEGVRLVARLAREGGDAFRVRGVRLDSGDLAALAREARRVLDDAGLGEVSIFASGNLDEHEVARLVDGGAPIAGFGVGTRMSVSDDAPFLDLAYKLAAYAGRGRMKLSAGKATLPGPKQVWRGEGEDVLALRDELVQGARSLSLLVMRGGRRTEAAAAATSIAAARETARRELAELPPRVRAIAPAEPPYPVRVSPGLAEEAARVRAGIGGG
jgi:nicotinate phosphoribosyltransferase